MKEKRTMDSYLQGLWLSIGLMTGLAPLILSIWICRRRKTARPEQTPAQAKAPAAPRAHCDLAIVEHRYEETEHGIHITGAIDNTSDRNWEDSRIVIDLYDDANCLLSHAEEYIWGALAPAESRRFSIHVWSDQSPERLTLRIKTADLIAQNTSTEV